MKVSAVHVPTNTEVCIGGPANAGEAVLKAAALRRLTYVLAKSNPEPPAAHPYSDRSTGAGRLDREI